MNWRSMGRNVACRRTSVHLATTTGRAERTGSAPAHAGDIGSVDAISASGLLGLVAVGASRTRMGSPPPQQALPPEVVQAGSSGSIASLVQDVLRGDWGIRVAAASAAGSDQVGSVGLSMLKPA